MRTSSSIAAAALVFVTGPGAPAVGTRGAAGADPLPAAQFYVSAIRTMSDVVQPPYATYRLESSSEGLQVDLTVIAGQVWLNIHEGSAPDRWVLRHRTYDYSSEIVNAADGHRYVSQRSFFDPTWYGASRALRQGMLYSQDPAPPRPSPGTATPPPDATLKTIGMISVMGPSVYDVADRGSVACPDGDPGRALHLTSRTKDSHHQLSDVVVDVRSLRFCMMRFGTASGFGFHGFVEQHYANVGGYWMQTDGVFDGTLRAFGIATHHGIWRYRLLDMRFPDSLPSDTFAPNTPPPESPQH